MSETTKRIVLPDGDFAIVDEADYPLVVGFKWRKGHPARASFTFVRAWTPRLEGHRKEILLHRLIAGASPGRVVVCLDGNGLNCRRANLLIGSRSDASHTQKKHSDKRGSKFKGVYFEKHQGRYHAQIMLDGKRTNLGRFATEKEAAEAYDRAARKHFREFAVTNVPVRKQTSR